MKLIEKKVEKLVDKYDTSDPFDLADRLGIFVRFVELGSIMGFHSRQYRTSIIHINQNTSEKEQFYICAHELGHAVLHPDINTSFLKKYTQFSTERIEREAHYFAMTILKRKSSFEHVVIEEAISDYLVPQRIIEKAIYSNKYFFD